MFGMNTPAYFCIDNIAFEFGGDGSSINELNQLSLSVYPNPTVDYLILDMDSKGINAQYAIINNEGKLVEQNSLANNNQIDVSNLPSGNYVLSVKSNEGVANKTFIKQ